MRSCYLLAHHGVQIMIAMDFNATYHCAATSIANSVHLTRLEIWSTLPEGGKSCSLWLWSKGNGRCSSGPHSKDPGFSSSLHHSLTSVVWPDCRNGDDDMESQGVNDSPAPSSMNGRKDVVPQT